MAPSITVSASFRDQAGNLVTPDSLQLQLFEAHASTPVETLDISSLSSRVSAGGVVFYKELDLSLYGTADVRAEWTPAKAGVTFEPATTIQYYRNPQVPTSARPFLAAEIRDWVRAELGYPHVEVELADEQIDQAIAFVLQAYNRRLPKRKLGYFRSSKDQTEYVLTEYGRGVVDVSYTRTTPNVLLSDPLFGRQFPPNQRVDYETYIRGTAYLEHLRRTTAREPNWRWLGEGRLLFAAPGESYNVTYTYLEDRSLEEIPEEHRDWFLKAVLARCKLTLGSVRGKFASIPGPAGDVSMDGEFLRTSGREEWQAAEEQLLRWQPPSPPRIR